MLTSTGLAAVVAVTVLASGGLLLSSGSPSSPPAGAPGASPSASSGVVWDSGSVRFEADAIEIVAGDRTFRGQPPYEVRSDPGDPSYRTLEVGWTEDGLEQRLYLYFAADEADWWVTEVRTRDGFADADWITYTGDLLLATPRGETFEGDVSLDDGEGRVSGRIAIHGLRLTAFAPGSGPTALTGCEPVRASVRSGAHPLDAGQPLAELGISMGMDPATAESLLRESGHCFTFRYSYPTDDSGGFSERWCSAPPAGVLDDLVYLDDGEIVAFVADDAVREAREQPPEGWGCEAG